MLRGNVVIKHDRNETLLRCVNAKCRAPVLVKTGRRVHFRGNNTSMGRNEAGALVYSGECPACRSRYSVSEEALFPAQTKEE